MIFYLESLVSLVFDCYSYVLGYPIVVSESIGYSIGKGPFSLYNVYII